jgi:hypothetical protein
VNLLLATTVVVAFAVLIERFNLMERAREVGSRALGSLQVLRDPELDDVAKEKVLRRQAVRLFGLVGILGGGSLLALGLPLLAVWLLDLGGVASLESVLAVLSSIEFLIGATIIGVMTFLLFRRIRQP